MIKYCLHRSKIRELNDKATDAFLPTFEIAPGWFAAHKTIKKLDDDHC